MRLSFLLVSAMFFGLTGCMGPISLHKAVLGYDETISQIEREMLLINIARTHCDIPTHFTVTSSIAATFDYQANIGLDGTFFERVSGGANKYGISLGASAAEKPTLSIVPIQGEDFTRRILTPLHESNFQFLVSQGAPIDMVMRLMVRGIIIQNQDGTFKRFIINWATHPEEYEEFRRRVLHLAWLNANRNLFVGRLSFDESVIVKKESAPSVSEFISTTEKGYRWNQAGDDGTYELVKPTAGRVVITNYDHKVLTNSERRALNDLAAKNPNNIVLVDIRPDSPGGEFPMFGGLKLRSFNEIMGFIASSIDHYPEYDVAHDPLSGKVTPNPAKTLTVSVDIPGKPEVLQVSYRGRNYTIGNTPWDREAFNLLYQLFQMTVTDVTGVGVPSITIAK